MNNTVCENLHLYEISAGEDDDDIAEFSKYDVFTNEHHDYYHDLIRECLAGNTLKPAKGNLPELKNDTKLSFKCSKGKNAYFFRIIQPTLVTHKVVFSKKDAPMTALFRLFQWFADLITDVVICYKDDAGKLVIVPESEIESHKIPDDCWAGMIIDTDKVSKNFIQDVLSDLKWDNMVRIPFAYNVIDEKSGLPAHMVHHDHHDIQPLSHGGIHWPNFSHSIIVEL